MFALRNVCPSKQKVHRAIEKFGQLDKRFDFGKTLHVLPFGNGGSAHSAFLGDAVGGNPLGQLKKGDSFYEFFLASAADDTFLAFKSQHVV